jgi:hypothetical protein
MSTRHAEDERAECERIEREIREFFAGYARAFDELDGDAIARRFSLPSMMSMNTGVVVWSRSEQVIENMRSLCEQYRRHGFLEAQWEMLDVVVQPPVHVFVNLRWAVHPRSGLSPWGFRTSYTLRRDNDAWRILLCAAYEEHEPVRVSADASVPNTPVERTRE